MTRAVDCPTRRESGSLPLGERGDLTLRIPAGQLRVAADAESSEVTYEIEIAAQGWGGADAASQSAQEELDRVVVRATSEGTAAEITVERGAASRGLEIEVILRARIPLACNLTLSAASGQIVVDRLVGNLRVEGQSGSIDLGEIEGDIDVSSGSGRLHVGKVTGQARIGVTSGQVTVDDAGDAVDIRQAAGQVAVGWSAAPNRASRIETTAGAVRLTLGAGVGVDLDAEARVGRVRIDPALLATTGRSSCRGQVQGGGMPLVVRSLAGSIAIGAAPTNG